MKKQRAQVPEPIRPALDYLAEKIAEEVLRDPRVARVRRMERDVEPVVGEARGDAR
jgi:hypothetical protein